MNPERTLEIGGRAYSILFSTNAAFQLDLYLRQNKLGAVEDLLARLASGRGGPADLQLMIWASLEGARRKDRSRSTPYPVDEVGDLIDEAGGLTGISEKVMEAVAAAQAKSTEESPAKNAKAARRSTGKTSSPPESA